MDAKIKGTSDTSGHYRCRGMNTGIRYKRKAGKEQCRTRKASQQRLLWDGALCEEWPIIRSKDETSWCLITVRKRRPTRQRPKVLTVTRNILRRFGEWLRKKNLDENVQQLHGDTAVVTFSLTPVLSLRMIILNMLCNAVTKLQYDFHISA